MRFIKTHFIFLFLFLLFAGTKNISAQSDITRFTPDSVKFLREISEFLLSARKEREVKKFLEDFTLVWNGGNFDDDERRLVYTTCNYMLERKMQPFPDFESYLFAVKSFVKSGQEKESFRAWQASVQKLCDSRNKKKLGEYLKFCDQLFSENAIYFSSTTKWTTSSSKYFFEFDENPFIVFPSLNLKCLAKNDSAVIYNTSGVYYPLLQEWKGKDGKVNWLRGGLPENQVYANIKNYQIKMKSPNYIADSVTFYNSIYFDKPLLGRLSDKVLANVTEENASYPRFESYNKRLKIKNIVENVNYDGGFSQNGPKFIGSGSAEEDALLIFFRNDKPFLVAASKSFAIRPDRITSDLAAITMYLEEDSITHPGLQLNFLKKERVLSLIRLDEGISKSPYYNTYHDVDMYLEEMRWKIDNPSIELGTLLGTTDKTITFESSNFYKEWRYDKIQGMDDFHPLIQIRDCAKQFSSPEIKADAIAECMMVAPSQVRQMLMKLSTMGFLHYDFDKNTIVLQDRLHHYIKAKSGKSDYDVIDFVSTVTEKNNAVLNLLNFDLRTEGVKSILLSDSHNVVIYPTRREITLKKNRDFLFSGVVTAGKFEIFGKEFAFEYDNFKIHMPNVDSVRIKVDSDEMDEYGERKLIRVKSIIEHVRGELLIDKPGNKSGAKDFPEYPILNSLKDSYVYYQKQDVFDGVYPKDRFYFHLEPFSFDSLDNFANEALQFKGSFTSAGIFPDFEEWLTLQPDFSLGFQRLTPAGGFEAYGGKGIYENKIKLSHKGLRGDGILKYLTSTAESKDFIFFPDSMNAIAQNFNVEEQMGGEVEYPPVFGKDVYIHWRPYLDFMTIKNTEKPINMYDQNTKFLGTLTLNPKQLTGKGEVQFKGAEMDAKLITFKFSQFGSDTAAFRLKNQEEGALGQLALSTSNVKALIDFKEQKGTFVSNAGGEFTEFPQNQYIAFLDKFTWFMESQDIELSATTKEKVGIGNEDVQLEGAKFISVHPDQDSLTFYSKAAKLDIKQNIIYAREVQFIPVADALIYPDSGYVTVEKKAKMLPLNNSVIVANNTTRYHTIYNATTNVFARKNYASSGDYDYVDENKRKQTIRFNVVKVDSTAQTIANGEIKEETGFTLSPKFDYKGNVNLKASRQYLNFEGASRIKHDCELLPLTWFRFSGEIDPQEIYIPIDTHLVDFENRKLSASIMLKPDSVSLYSTFLSPETRFTDKRVLPSHGFLFYEKGSNEYRISNLAKLSQPSLPGNYISLLVDSCAIYAEGTGNFGTNLGKVKITPIGNIIHSMNTNDFAMEFIMLLDFFFDENTLENMAKKIAEFPGLEGVPLDRKVFEKGIYELMSKEDADKMISQINLYGSYKKTPQELSKTMFLTDVKIKWNPETRTYQSDGKIGIGNLLKKQVNKYVDGHIEIEKKRSADILNIYFEIDKNTWYYFNYQRGLMQAVSSDEAFNTVIKSLKADKRKVKAEKGEEPYSFNISTPVKKKDFLKRFEKIE